MFCETEKISIDGEDVRPIKFSSGASIGLSVAKVQNSKPYVGHTHFAKAMCCTEEAKSDQVGKSGGIQCIVFRMFVFGKCVKSDRSVRYVGGQSCGVMSPRY